MPIVILEGIDGSGKTSFGDLIEAEARAAGFKVTREHRGQPIMPAMNEYFYPLLGIGSDELLIADRWHVGELIYGPIYRGKSKTKGAMNRLVESYLDVVGAVKIIMSPSLKVVKQRIATRGEDYLLDEHVNEVYKFYRKYAKRNGYVLVGNGTRSLASQIVEGL